VIGLVVGIALRLVADVRHLPAAVAVTILLARMTDVIETMIDATETAIVNGTATVTDLEVLMIVTGILRKIVIETRTAIAETRIARTAQMVMTEKVC
jgi:hypothetical protein